MTAQYPSAVKSFTTKVDFTDTVLAEHVNTLQDEVRSLQVNLGTFISTGSGWVGDFDQVTTSWTNLKDRLANIEYGLNDVYVNAVVQSGGSTIQTSGTSTVSLTVRAQTSQTANLLDFKNSSGSIVAKVEPSGKISTVDNLSVGGDASVTGDISAGEDISAIGAIYSGTKRLVPVIYSSSLPTSVPAGTVWVDSSSDPAILTAQSGVPSGGSTGQMLVKSSNDNYATTWSNDGSGITNLDIANFVNYIHPMMFMGA